MNKSKRIEIWNKCNQRCAYCGEKIECKNMQIDHIKPAVDLRNYKKYLKLSKKCDKNDPYKEHYLTIAEQCLNRVIHDFGSIENVDLDSNLLPSCADCNRYKASYGLEKYREYLKTLHLRMEYKSRMKLELFRKYKVNYNQPWDGVFYFEKM